MTGLEELTLYRTKVSNAGLARLAALSHLRALDVRYTRVTAAGVKEMVARVPGVTVLADEGASRTAKRSVDMASPAGRGEDDWGVAGIGCSYQTPRCPHRRCLTGIVVDYRPQIAILRELPQLEDLSLRNTEISDLGLGNCQACACPTPDVSHTLLRLGVEALLIGSPVSLTRVTRHGRSGVRRLVSVCPPAELATHLSATMARAPRKAHDDREGVAGARTSPTRHRTPGGARRPLRR
jgi:hypothetical protein